MCLRRSLFSTTNDTRSSGRSCRRSAHHDRFNAIVNQLDLNKDRTDKIQIIGVGGGNSDGDGGNGTPDERTHRQTMFAFPHLEDWENAIFAKIVVKCGNRRYWESWAQDVAKIAERHVTRIKALLESATSVYRKKFDTFLLGLRKTLNPSITELDAIEMLSQHLITKPVFDALFEGYEFTKHNPVSKTMQKMLDLLEEQALAKETASLEKFYESVRECAEASTTLKENSGLLSSFTTSFSARLSHEWLRDWVSSIRRSRSLTSF